MNCGSIGTSTGSWGRQSQTSPGAVSTDLEIGHSEALHLSGYGSMQEMDIENICVYDCICKMYMYIRVICTYTKLQIIHSTLK